jgi:CheY-like chemotaxis protein
MPVENRKRVLIAEDDPAIAKMLAKVLEEDYEVAVTNDGIQALALARQHPPDLLLADVMMPGLDGFQLAERLRREPGLSKLRIVFLTARDGPVDVVRGIQVGARHYLTKPFKLKDVRDKVAKALK